MSGDSTYIVTTRRNLFNKINNEITTFTPFEKFFYFDAQSNTSASAPGICKNYANTPSINLNYYYF